MSESKILKDGEYILKDDALWLEVENISIRVRKTNVGVCVYLYGKGCEDEDCIRLGHGFNPPKYTYLNLRASTCAYFDDAPLEIK